MLSKWHRSKPARIEQHGGYTYIYDYRKFLRGRSKGRALLSYLPLPIRAELEGQNTVRFSNDGIGLSWARVLNELGYVVDIISWDDETFRPTKPYDLVVFHGGKNFEPIRAHLQGSPQIIHFLTGSYWKFNNEHEDARIADFQKRHGVKVPRDRYIYASEDPVNEAADGIIVLGDPSMRGTYPKHYKKVLTIHNASFPDSHFDEAKKDYNKARNNFLYYAGSGTIHKGLDLLIDSFKDLKLHLYIVGRTDEEVMDVFKNELRQPNIHLIGEVGMRSKEFYQAMDSCAFVILPSCSEGQAGSVIECMNHGLIPIVSKETRLDSTKYGAVLADNKIPTIQKTVQTLANKSGKEVETMAREVRKIATSVHSPEYFRSELTTAIQKILNF